MLRARTFALRFKNQNIKNRYTMKKIIKAISLIAFSAAFTACGDNGGDTRETEVNVNDMAGTYAGYTLASCSYFQDMLAEDQTITVTAGTDGTVSLGYVSVFIFRMHRDKDGVGIQRVRDRHHRDGDGRKYEQLRCISFRDHSR